MVTMLFELVLFLLACSCCSSLEEGGDGWVLTGPPSSQATLSLTFAIKQANVGWLKEKLMEVSYPNSLHYGQHMNFDEIAEYVYGRPESVQAVQQALKAAGVSYSAIDYTLGRDFAFAEVPVEAAAEMFSAVFYEYEHQECEKKVVRSESYAIPLSLKDHLDFVSGIEMDLSYPCTKSRRPRQNVRMNSTATTFKQNLGISPTTLATDYNTSDYTSTNQGNSQAVASFLKQYYDPKDLSIFQRKFDLPDKPIAKVVGENKPDDPGAEANLDVQYISAMGRGVSTWFIFTGTYSNGRQEDFVSWITSQVNNTDSPWVHSASYGDVEKSIDDSYLTRVDNEFMKFGVSGRTVLFASGDSGVDCKLKGLRKEYTPAWPASSPYVTAVGGTEGKTRVWGSGGSGFSNFFPMPDYQKEAVQAYLDKYPDTSKFNKSGRAYPDVSAFATDFIIVDDGAMVPVDGTSCAAPTFAGIVSILNDVRLNKQKSTLGFLNPLLYQTLMGNGFTDITEGQNGDRLCEGFQATTGWDPASGWGSPNFGALKGMI